jgi:hypothetical protein
MNPPADQTAGEIYGNKNWEYGEKGADRCGKGYCVGKTPSPLTPFKT